MIGIVQKLQKILQHLIDNRQVGTTTLIRKVAKENDIYVLVRQTEERIDFDKSVRKNVITPETLYKIKEGKEKPILIDNGILHELLVDTLLKIGEQEEIINKKNRALKEIKEFVKSV